MISRAFIEKAMYGAMRLAATRVPPDVRSALDRCREEETEPLALLHLDITQENFRLAEAGAGLVCADTGYPLFFVRAGSRTRIEGGFGALWDAARGAVARATADAYLRPTLVDPLRRDNPGDNVGTEKPSVDLSFSGDGDGLDILAAPKGGGSEIFGTFYRMLVPADGPPGICRFVLDAVRAGCYAGKICPPAIIGVGLGGTADGCMKRAKEAALLRRVGSAHRDAEIARLESELLAACRELGLGPMGAKGVNAVMAVHVAAALTHTAALPVAVNAQCLVGRRWRALLDGRGAARYTGGLEGWPDEP